MREDLESALFWRGACSSSIALKCQVIELILLNQSLPYPNYPFGEQVYDGSCALQVYSSVNALIWVARPGLCHKRPGVARGRV
jgi:hypothetical protein